MADQAADAMKLAQQNKVDTEGNRQALIRAKKYVDEQHKSQETKMTNMMKLIEKLSKGLQDHHKILTRMEKQLQQLQKSKK